MNFFESQDRARRNTRFLLILYACAVISIVVMTNLLILVAAGFQDSVVLSSGQLPVNWEVVATVTLVVLLVIGGGSLYRIASLSSGGAVVAEMLNGQLLSDAGSSLEKRRLLNVVEEMAIASGTPVPPVYVIPEAGINAFAAGYSSGDAVIGVTEGAMQQLNRDQLQGVIAHEFSHILNGDMRLNIRLMGALYGILMLAVIGRLLLSGTRVRRSSRNNGAGAILAVGIGLFVLGYLGKFFGSLIKAAVSRQREFLADASAVQFTRHPDGISGALQRIGGYESGSLLEHPESEEISHAFFATGVKFSFSGLLATHPPLAERIKRIDPEWSGDFLTERQQDTAAAHAQATEAPVTGLAPGPQRLDAQQMFAAMGQPGVVELAAAQQLLAAMPAALRDAAHEPFSARALIYLLLLDQQAEVRDRQLAYLRREADAPVMRSVDALLLDGKALAPALRLPLLELAMPALRQLTKSQYAVFKANIEALIRADKKVSLSEWALQKFVIRHLEEAQHRARVQRKHINTAQAGSHCRVLLSALAFSDSSPGNPPEQAFARGQKVLGEEMQLLRREAVDLASLDLAVERLSQLQPLLKPRLLKACIAVITADGVVTPLEFELVRTVADCLDCPMPPLPG